MTSNFKLSCCLLLEKYPLVKYRTLEEENHYSLKVLLVGSGARMDTLFRKILVSGQLLDTDLHVAVVTSNVAKTAKALLTKAPELKNYARVTCDGVCLNESPESNTYADIHYHSFRESSVKSCEPFTQFREIIKAYIIEGYHYAIVSAGNDEENRTYAQIISEILPPIGLVAYVQDKKPAPTAVVSPTAASDRPSPAAGPSAAIAAAIDCPSPSPAAAGLSVATASAAGVSPTVASDCQSPTAASDRPSPTTVASDRQSPPAAQTGPNPAAPVAIPTTFAFGFQKDKAYMEKLEAIAYNLHYCYCKANNDHVAGEEITTTFLKPYNYVSNLEAAMHIQQKLACCGIDASDPAGAAEEFNRLMKKDPAVIDRLAALEHRRWMMEKMLDGYVQVESLDYIYSGEDITTHDSSKKWHVCLLPCSETSHISQEDWNRIENPALDLLDNQTLKIHQKCRTIAKANRPQIEDALRLIHNSVQLILKEDEKAIQTMDSMERAVSQMLQYKRSVIPIYEGNLRTLLEIAESKQNSQAFMLKQSLVSLNHALSPLKEFLAHKDYKDQDRLLVRQIPFALTHKKQMVLVKLLAEKESTSLFSTCFLEPDCTVFTGIVADHTDYLAIKNQIPNINRFLTNTYPGIRQKYHLLLTESLADDHAEKIKALCPEISLHIIREADFAAVENQLGQICRQEGADYIDVTGSSPLLMMSAANLGIPLTAHKAGSMINIQNAAEITCQMPKKSISVREMFDLSGAVLKEKSDSSVLSDLSARYKVFYSIAGEMDNWALFCNEIAQAYKKQTILFPVLSPSAKAKKESITLNADAASALLPVLEEMEKQEYISKLAVERSLENQKIISFSAPGDEAEAVLAKIRECEKLYTSTTSYKVAIKRNQPLITCSDLWIRNLHVRGEKGKEYRKTLDHLEKSQLILDYTVEEPNRSELVFSFQFASRDILSVIQSSGKVLEYYIYYSALLESHFDDVEMGWHFQHTSARDSADNELDIICTKGISSLFISAKNVANPKDSKENRDNKTIGSQSSRDNGENKESKENRDIGNLNYYIYEISSLAGKFGINARCALAMPKFPQFKANEETGELEFSPEAKLAYKRGVYLLGKECFQKDALGKVLDNIADGREDWCDFLKQQKEKVK